MELTVASTLPEWGLSWRRSASTLALPPETQAIFIQMCYLPTKLPGTLGRFLNIAGIRYAESRDSILTMKLFPDPDPHNWIKDPDPALFFRNFQDANKF